MTYLGNDVQEGLGHVGSEYNSDLIQAHVGHHRDVMLAKEVRHVRVPTVSKPGVVNNFAVGAFPVVVDCDIGAGDDLRPGAAEPEEEVVMI